MIVAVHCSTTILRGFLLFKASFRSASDAQCPVFLEFTPASHHSSNGFVQRQLCLALNLDRFQSLIHHSHEALLLFLAGLDHPFNKTNIANIAPQMRSHMGRGHVGNARKAWCARPPMAESVHALGTCLLGVAGRMGSVRNVPLVRSVVLVRTRASCAGLEGFRANLAPGIVESAEEGPLPRNLGVHNAPRKKQYQSLSQELVRSQENLL